jgi:hypothetical protein
VILGAGVVEEGGGVEVCEITPAANVKTAATIVRGAVECMAAKVVWLIQSCSDVYKYSVICTGLKSCKPRRSPMGVENFDSTDMSGLANSGPNEHRDSQRRNLARQHSGLVTLQ